jgi:hypothetical protein
VAEFAAYTEVQQQLENTHLRAPSKEQPETSAQAAARYANDFPTLHTPQIDQATIDSIALAINRENVQLRQQTTEALTQYRATCSSSSDSDAPSFPSSYTMSRDSNSSTEQRTAYRQASRTRNKIFVLERKLCRAVAMSTANSAHRVILEEQANVERGIRWTEYRTYAQKKQVQRENRRLRKLVTAQQSDQDQTLMQAATRTHEADQVVMRAQKAHQQSALLIPASEVSLTKSNQMQAYLGDALQCYLSQVEAAKIIAVQGGEVPNFQKARDTFLYPG